MDEPEGLLIPVSQLARPVVEADYQSEAPVDENKQVVEGLDVNGLPDRSKAQQKFSRRPSKLNRLTSKSKLTCRTIIPPTTHSYTHPLIRF